MGLSLAEESGKAKTVLKTWMRYIWESLGCSEVSFYVFGAQEMVFKRQKLALKVHWGFLPIEVHPSVKRSLQTEHVSFNRRPQSKASVKKKKLSFPLFLTKKKIGSFLP